MVDEAHSLGVLGATGRGIAEEQGVDPADIDIWMGTLSKALVSTGGYIAGSRKLIELLKYTSPGFVYSVGASPSVAAAAYAALAVMQPRTMAGREAARERPGFPGWRLRSVAWTPASASGRRWCRSSWAVRPTSVILSQRLLARGYNVVPIIFPGVAENQSRLRFFITSRHAPKQMAGVLDAIAEELPAIRRAPSFVAALAEAR